MTGSEPLHRGAQAPPADRPGDVGAVPSMPCCSGCGQRRRLPYRRDGELICGSCYARGRPQILCPGCARQKTPWARIDGVLLCTACYQRGRSRPCAGCGQTRPVAYRIRGQAYCQRCGPRPCDTCADCGRDRPIHANRFRDDPVADNPDEAGTSAGTSSGGPVCVTCYHRRRRLAARPVCCDCGRVGGFVAAGRCACCGRLHQVDQLLRGPDGDCHPQLAPLHAWFADRDSNGVQQWLSGRSASVLRELAESGAEFTHELLDELPHRGPGQRLRRLLVDAGVLPLRADGGLDACDAWLERLLSRHSEHAAVLGPYAQWSVLRRARTRAVRGTPAVSAGDYARTRIGQAAQFLTWLDDQHLHLAEVTQAHVDAWLAEGASTRHRVRDFLTWTAARGLTGELHVSWLGRERGVGPTQIVGEDERWTLLRRCLTDQELPLRLRVAGALVLLYAQRPTRLVQLTTADLSADDAGRSYLRIHRQPVLLPPRLAALVDQLARQSPPRPDGPAWLFPGRASNVHSLGAGRLTLLLNDRLGLSVRAARGGALCDLAAELPAPVLAHLFGMSINTAVRWGEVAKHNWTAYLAERAATIPDPEPESLSDPAGMMPAR